jgi:endonuclease G
VALVAGATLTLAGTAASAACPQHFLQQKPPELTNPKLKPKTSQICYLEFALLHSGLTRTPLWAAEHLTSDRAQGARDLTRLNSFHADPNLPPDERAELSDYTRSGFDRGHMAPAGDMSTPEAMDQSFSLANMVPQDSDLNRNLWESIERAVRDFSARHGDLYVVTGPIFRGENLQSLKGRVLVPTHIFKAVYDPQKKAGAAYLVENKQGSDFEVISLARLQELASIDVFPGVSQEIKRVAAELPQPRLRRQPTSEGRARQRFPRPDGSRTGPPAPDDDFVGGILDAIDKMGRGR